ncbi:MAG: VWA domain-containing protein [Rhodospirillales bacterium]|nr:VWA domain-containing protein [Rhodospirillales bacterium]MCB9994936.1 VWA domain-containing protein [Rhodospirillales bacterium]
MDERQLKKALNEIDVPAPGENAKKRALNLALAEFEQHQKKNQKKFQGNSFLSRLMGYDNQTQRRKAMFGNKKMVYGGMATAMALVLVTAVSLQDFNQTIGSGSSVNTSTLNTVDYTSNITKSTSLPAPLLRANKPRQEGRAVIAEKKMELAEAEADFAVAPSAPEPMFNAGRMAVTSQESNLVRGQIAGMPATIALNDVIAPPGYKEVGRDKFEDFEENTIKLVSQEPVSTFSIDVDTASYAFMRRQIENGVLPQKDAVRIEELINYFDYDYKLPENKEQPFEPTVTVVPSPWKDGNKLMHIGIKGYDIAPEEKPRSNLVFLLDVSGSMNAQDKLPLLKNSMKLLLDTMSPDDTISIVVYAGAAGTVLEPTKASEKAKIITALENLSAGGSTAGAEGIRQAYNLAESSFDKDAVNRVILATDGDFNVGITNREELKDFIERKRDTGIFLSVLGFGQGNYNDHLMQELAQNGNGTAAYIDSLSEARKVLVEEASSTLFPIAKDVKIQVEFNPATVAEYRLIGYETRHLNREDFNNDAVDAGDIGAGHTVTAIYEITPVDGPRMVDNSRYAANEPAAQKTSADTDFSSEYAFLKIRYKLPEEDTSNLITTPVTKAGEQPALQGEAAWATAVAGFGQLLKGGKYTDNLNYDDVIEWAQASKGDDPYGYRAEFINLVRLAKSAAALQDTRQ